MSYHQIRDILTKLASYYEMFRTFLTDAIEQGYIDLNDNGRREWLTRYLDTESNAVAEALSELQQQGNQRILDTWLQYFPDEELQRTVQKMQSASTIGWEDMLDLVQRFDRAVRNLCSVLADQSSIPEVRGLFDAISEQSQHFLEQTAWGMRSDEESYGHDLAQQHNSIGENQSERRQS